MHGHRSEALAILVENHSLIARTTREQRLMSKLQEEPCQPERKVRAVADMERVPAKLSPVQCAAERRGPCAPVRAAKAGRSRAANRRSRSVYQKQEKKAPKFLRRVPRKRLNKRRRSRGLRHTSESRFCGVTALQHAAQTPSRPQTPPSARSLLHPAFGETDR